MHVHTTTITFPSPDGKGNCTLPTAKLLEEINAIWNFFDYTDLEACLNDLTLMYYHLLKSSLQDGDTQLLILNQTYCFKEMLLLIVKLNDFNSELLKCKDHE